MGTPPPTIQSIAFITNNVELTWDAIPGQTYFVQFRTNLNGLDWAELIASNAQMQAVDPAADSFERFCRLRVGP